MTDDDGPYEIGSLWYALAGDRKGDFVAPENGYYCYTPRLQRLEQGDRIGDFLIPSDGWHRYAPTWVHLKDEEYTMVRGRQHEWSLVVMDTPPPNTTQNEDTVPLYPPGHYSTILDLGVVFAKKHPTVGLALTCGPNDLVVYRRRVRCDENDRPVCVSTSWFRRDMAEHAPMLTRPLRIVEGTAQYLARHLGTELGTTDVSHAAGRARPEEAVALRIETGAPVLLRRSTIHDVTGRVLEFGVSVRPAHVWI